MRSYLFPLILFASVLSVVLPLPAQQVEETQQDPTDAFLEIVKACFNDDCDRFYSFFDDSLKIINPYVDTVVDARPIAGNRKACENLEGWAKETGSSTFEEYLRRYKIHVFTYREYTDLDFVDTLVFQRCANAQIIFRCLAYYPGGLTEDDYLVIGDTDNGYPLIGRGSGDHDVNTECGGGPFELILRRTTAGWKIRATLP